MDKSLTVGELKKALEGVADDIPVYLDLSVYGLKHEQSYVDSVLFCGKTAISNDHLMVTATREFGW